MYIEYYLFLNREKMTQADILLLYCTSTDCFLPYLHTIPPSPASPAAFLYCLYTNTSSCICTLLKFILLSYDIENDLGRLVHVSIYMTNCILNMCILECVCLSKYVFCNVQFIVDVLYKCCSSTCIQLVSSTYMLCEDNHKDLVITRSFFVNTT